MLEMLDWFTPVLTIQKMYKNKFLYEETHRYFKNDYQFFDDLRIKDRKMRVNCNS